ncbi:MAG: IS1096 element passenger TnpR family protein, partial [Owenweeksia sp.]
MNYRVRIVLDTDEDVIRDIELNGDAKLNTLHESIIKAFKLYKGEMASFFISNQLWEQGAEISLVNFGNSAHSGLMAQKSVSEVMPEKGDRMIYVYDFLNLWTFFL